MITFFLKIPELRNDIVIPDYCSITSRDCDDDDDDVNINAWFGPAGTVSPCHHDPKHNLLAQVIALYSLVCTDTKRCLILCSLFFRLNRKSRLASVQAML